MIKKSKSKYWLTGDQKNTLKVGHKKRLLNNKKSRLIWKELCDFNNRMLKKAFQ